MIDTEEHDCGEEGGAKEHLERDLWSFLLKGCSVVVVVVVVVVFFFFFFFVVVFVVVVVVVDYSVVID